MKKKGLNRRNVYVAVALLAAFGIWTVLLRLIDVQAIGPRGSSVGMATLNRIVHRLTGVHFSLYTITDWLGLVPIGTAFGFAVLGLIQWIKRKDLRRVDRSILALGVFYIVVMAAYAFFETVVVNYRPVLINGCLEASYPSSTTLLTLCVMPAAMMQLKKRIQGSACRRVVLCSIAAFTAFMVLGRLASGVHWITDIIGGGLLSGGLLAAYAAVSGDRF